MSGYWDDVAAKREDNDRREREARQIREEERRASYMQRMLSASDWPDAFAKNRSRFIQKAIEAERFFDEYPEEAGEPWFDIQVKVNERAEALYLQAEKDSVAQIKAIQAGTRALVIAALRAEFGDKANTVIGFLEKDDPNGYVNW